MIAGNIFAKEDLSIYPKPIQSAIQYLKSHDLASHKAGRFELDGENMILQVIDLKTSERESLRPEVHRKYIDVQFLAAGGPEYIAWYPDQGNNEIEEELLEERDIIFYKNNSSVPQNLIEMTLGSYAIFFPWEVHVPGILVKQAEGIRKVVIKIAISTL